MKINMTSALLYWIAFKLYLPLHNYLKWWLWSITHSSWNIEVFMGCKDALDDPDGVYRNSDGLLVRVEPRSLTWAELLGSDSASPRLRLGVQPKSDSSAQLWLVDRLSYYKIYFKIRQFTSHNNVSQFFCLISYFNSTRTKVKTKHFLWKIEQINMILEHDIWHHTFKIHRNQI